jgi:NAD(P)-dependent dehydrogenase (short-subunit alcohol dehydrogenase family)
MIDARWGRIINIASTVARVAYPGIAAYATSKHASLGLTRALAVETARSGVTVNAVCPGYVDTELTRENARRLAKKRGQSLDQALAMLAASCPQRRLIAPGASPARRSKSTAAPSWLEPGFRSRDFMGKNLWLELE